MDNFSLIWSGYKNYVFPNPEVKKMAEDRAKICAACPKLEDTLIEIPDSIKSIKGKKCGECNCPLTGALRSPRKSCPLGKW